MEPTKEEIDAWLSKIPKATGNPKPVSKETQAMHREMLESALAYEEAKLYEEAMKVLQAGGDYTAWRTSPAYRLTLGIAGKKASEIWRSAEKAYRDPLASSSIPSFEVYDLEKESFLHKDLTLQEASVKTKSLNDAEKTAKTRGRPHGADNKFVVKEIEEFFTRRC